MLRNHDLKENKLADLSLEKRSVKDAATLCFQRKQACFQRKQARDGLVSKKPHLGALREKTNRLAWFQRKQAALREEMGQRRIDSHGFKESKPRRWYASLGFKESTRRIDAVVSLKPSLVSKKPQREMGCFASLGFKETTA